MTIRTQIEEFIYPILENYTDMVYKNGDGVTFHGVKLLDDESKFTHGALVNAAATLYAYYVRTNDKRADEVLKRLHYFIKIAAENTCKTWGKVAILRGFLTLNKAGLLANIKPEYIELVKSRTDYDDFFDKSTLTLRGMATNYLHVALACAGMRERLGFENEGYSGKIIKKLIEVLENGTLNGWMDDEIPAGRFDKYSFVLTSEFADTARMAQLPLPEFIKDNIRLSAEAILFCANKKGDCVSYGRSVAAHGDTTATEVLSTAFAEGLINEDMKPYAVTYSLAVINKIISFWYDEKRMSINMWWDGRGHDIYRPIDRLLETNLDMINHLYMLLENFSYGKVADIDVSVDLKRGKELELYSIDFIEDIGKNVKKTLLLRKEDTLIMLPFVGIGNGWGIHSAYFPFPAISGGILEAAQSARYPFFTPEYTDKEGNKYLPVQNYTRVDVSTRAPNLYTVHAEGTLALRTETKLFPSEYTFAIDYVIKDDEIKATFKTELDYVNATMYLALGRMATNESYSAFGFKNSESIYELVDDGLDAPHGRLKDMTKYTLPDSDELGYILKL